MWMALLLFLRVCVVVSPRCVPPVFYPQTEEGFSFTWTLVSQAGTLSACGLTAESHDELEAWTESGGRLSAASDRYGRFKTRSMAISPPAAAGGSFFLLVS